ncbi:MAG: short-chain dehydrogenase [Pseudomonadales bacterium]|jgi:3-oxoacyl-[acyl-carrier protein] reductase|uniref:SDR family NAD(P)-dependent oxidoreductase n=1 Tax=Halopseudomonas TaxID=2901189 RepID=UPI000C6C24BB|nr:SDR family NAD(P)-dependent oxidoreductase [Halopseudomonas aestusnigri]MAD27623.1 short-chain dehydrogenase [Pseudomonadales bacterium]MAS66272.1 short-chain dehydrogenase [Pseudomonadales bacterium]MCC4259077.1 SDR family oxidoreductase [Halopseudomonas aestusnigri]MCK5533362.1 SDR family oxidoreductase [Halopseudomonas aestusnigri]|tara:strand:+ start:5369 stop:6160 length:792 start_codon:yes stop_codon:yes gene_type:complete
MNLDLQDKVVVITGPAKGMGRAITLAFAREGARLVLAGRDLDAIAPVAREVTELGSEVEVVRCDMTRSTDAEALAAAALNCFGRIDVLVNVAGGSGPIGKTGWETTQSEFDEIVQLNMTGCFNTMRAVMPAMIEQGSGKIVNVGGTFGMRGRAGRMAYSASKWGLRGITKSFALEAGPHGINVNCVAPGMVDGPRFRDKVCANMAAQLDISPEEAATRHAADYALKRVSTDQDVANACLFLGSDVSRQITGVDLPVDGGWAML